MSKIIKIIEKKTKVKSYHTDNITKPQKHYEPKLPDR